MAGQRKTKTAARTATSPLSGGVIPLGNHPGNTGGKKGRSGAKPLWWKEFCRTTISDPKVQKVIARAAADPKTQGWTSLIRTLAEYAEGLPSPITLTSEERRARIAELLGLE